MKIWLDDAREAPSGYIWVKNLEELKKLLEDKLEPIEIMDFDHDLGMDEKGNLEPDGYMIIKWLFESHPKRYPQKINVHSQNPVGKDNILKFHSWILKYCYSR